MDYLLGPLVVQYTVCCADAVYRTTEVYNMAILGGRETDGLTKTNIQAGAGGWRLGVLCEDNRHLSHTWGVMVLYMPSFGHVGRLSAGARSWEQQTELFMITDKHLLQTIAPHFTCNCRTVNLLHLYENYN